MVVACRISVPAADAGPYRTPVPGDRYWTLGQWRLLSVPGARGACPFPATARFVEIRYQVSNFPSAIPVNTIDRSRGTIEGGR